MEKPGLYLWLHLTLFVAFIVVEYGQSNFFFYQSVLIPDGFVDIGSYIRLNENTIKLVQDGDLFAYVYCLHIHLPTLAQVQKLNQQIEKQEEWETWCKNVSGPLDLPPSKFSTGSIHMHML